MSTPLTYENRVIKAGDTASNYFKNAARKANKTSRVYREGLLRDNRVLHPATGFVTEGNQKKPDIRPGYEVQTDGVGTKVRIYMQAFNSLYESYRIDKAPEKRAKLLDTAKTLFYRMFLDLFAMNVDDFRHGDLALAVSDILDIDQITLDGEDAEQGQIFCEGFAHAIGRVIETTGIALVAGETAVMGDGDKLNATRKNMGGIVNDVLGLEQILAGISETVDLPDQVHKLVMTTRMLVRNASTTKTIQEGIDRSVELNLGGGTIGYRNGQKLAKMEAGHVVIAIFEKKTEKGIISPRANGISAIRATMTNLLGDDWAMKTLRDYFAAITEKGISIDAPVYERLSKMGLDTPLWDIATGETTIFNPLVAGTILGGMHCSPHVEGVSGQIHFTGNPIGKGADAVEGTGFGMDLDYTRVENPQIIEMCMIADSLDFTHGMKKFNMGIPYGLICDPKKVDYLLMVIRGEGYEADIVGKITAPGEEAHPVINITYPGGTSQVGVDGIRK